MHFPGVPQHIEKHNPKGPEETDESRYGKCFFSW